MSVNSEMNNNFQGQCILLFGPLATGYNETSFSRLRKSVINRRTCQWILEVFAELPKYWKSLSVLLPNSRAERGLQQIEDLINAFMAGEPWQAGSPTMNTILVPLTVAAQLTEYIEFLELTGADMSSLGSEDQKQTLGICTGLLTAFAISSAGNRDRFMKFGAVALRIGMLIGMVIDAQAESTVSLSVAWNSHESGEKARQILDSIAETYISVHFDENRFTVTTPKQTASQLRQQLNVSGIVASEIGLNGSFHSKYNAEALRIALEFCDTHPEFQFPDASDVAIPTRSNENGNIIKQGPLHHHALRSILFERLNYYEAFQKSIYDAGHGSEVRQPICFGPERCIPPSVMRENHVQPIIAAEIISKENKRTYSDNDVAVVGMACKVAGADSLEEFWNLMVVGKSQHKEVKDRFGFVTAFRTPDPSQKWFANFISDPDMFDHKFFKKSARESATMDPQQRQILQVAYQAVEQSGYFQSPHPAKTIGCYIGVRGCDYYDNVACHPPNAFSATGNLQAFIAGKVSHFFGWTGPGMTIDTACSSSMVAIHQACRAIISGECTGALAGGAHIMTSPLWHQNLAGASFLSPTGQCKPFDAKADGYCRGDGVAAVFLKKMSAAVADGDQILGVIRATGVQQNQNCTPIFVPNVPSLSDLFTRVIKDACINPADISVVEAHGTGTQVGDPAEYNAIRQVLGGKGRSNPLILNSIKGLVGHSECASGAVSMVKLLLMIQKGMVPPQASFTTLNPAINANPPDQITIPTQLIKWGGNSRVALINNYGASGSNAAIILAQPPAVCGNKVTGVFAEDKCCFWFSGLDDNSLRRYVGVFRKFVQGLAKDILLSDLSFNLSRQSNRLLDRALILSAQSVDELERKLASFENNDAIIASTGSHSPKPVVLCFGGQVSSFIGLDREIYDRIFIFRKHLDSVDAILQTLGINSIFPGIFQRTTVEDIVELQSMLFAIQYAIARTWMDVGVHPVALVGHSFGELTALCISQSLSLEDSIKMVVNRATIIRDHWGSESGAMMAIEASLSDVESVLFEANRMRPSESPVSIACYNGPHSFTIAGPGSAIDAIPEIIAKTPDFSSMKTKKLNVTNSFHCTLVDPLMDHLEQCTQGLAFREPVIPLERATATPLQQKPSPRFVADHLRNPVFFHKALERIYAKFPSCIILEAGSNSTVTSMASRALGNPSSCDFQAMNITSDGSFNKLTDATVKLWNGGLRVHHWTHHAAQAREYLPLFLPPYQFEKSRHWIELKAIPDAAISITAKEETEKVSDALLTLIGYQDSNMLLSRFRINTMVAKFDKLISGHLIVQTAPICPATVQIGLIIEGIVSLRAGLSKSVPQIYAVDYQSPICVNVNREVWFEVTEESKLDGTSWNFEVFSTEVHKRGSKDRMIHTTGRIVFRDVGDEALERNLSQFQRLFAHGHCVGLLEDNKVDDVLASRTIYKLFSDLIDYSEEYRGIDKMVVRGNQTAASITRKSLLENSSDWDAHLLDSFCQIGGVWANNMTEKSLSDVFIANAIEQWIRAPKPDQRPAPTKFHVFATHSRPSDKISLSDVFIFNAESGALLEVILGINYVKVPKTSLRKLLERLTSNPNLPGVSASPLTQEQVELSSAIPSIFSSPQQTGIAPQGTKTPAPAQEKKSSQKSQIASKVKDIVADLSGLEPDVIKNDSLLGDLGIDSLTGMELVHEIDTTFNITLPQDDIADITNMTGLIKCVQDTLGDGGEFNEDSDDSSDNSDIIESASGSQAWTAATELDAESRAGVDDSPTVNCGDTRLNFNITIEAFNEVKKLVDNRVSEYEQTHYVKQAMPMQAELCIAQTIEAFERLGSPLRSAKPGHKVALIPYQKEHRHFVEYLYRMLEKETQGLLFDGESITRTAVPLPVRPSKEIYQDLLARFPDQDTANKLAFYAGSNLADVLSGKSNGVKLIFGSQEGRELVSNFYANWPLNQVSYRLMQDFLSLLIKKMSTSELPLKILELGAGTGGTTEKLLPLLAKLNVPIEYTFTDLAGSFVAAARKRFGKEYPFMKFRTHDIEKTPAEDLIGTQHIVIASNAVHAVHNICESTRNVRMTLRPEGFLLMLEMTRTPYWVDIVFGLFEGWWLFDDGRTHALTHESRWKTDLQAAGYGHVDWTEGNSAESEIEKLIIATATGPRCERLQLSKQGRFTDCTARQHVIDCYVREMTEGFEIHRTSQGTLDSPVTKCVLVTGCTGSLGSHLVAKAATLSNVTRVICLNRITNQDARQRQKESLETKGIVLSDEVTAKLSIFETELFKHNLGLSPEDYEDLINNVTHITHNAWSMSLTWPLHRFQPQLQAMRNLLELSRHISKRRQIMVTFQFISSIAAVGNYPQHAGTAHVPEERMETQAVLPNGYGDAKHICERMLDATLHRFPANFRAMAVRLGQIAGSSTSGYWNAKEHVSFIIKSSQTLNALPDLDGVVSWTPVDYVASTLIDLVMLPDQVITHPIYHIDNPVRQPWKDMVVMLARAMDIPLTNIIPYAEWVQRVAEYQHAPGRSKMAAHDNPAYLLIDFMKDKFVRMSCGALLLSTKKAREHSRTLAAVGPVSEDTVRLFIKAWRDSGYLH